MKSFIEIALLLTMAGGVFGGLWTRIHQSKGIGVRFIQFLGLTVLVPIIGLLTLEDRISQEMTGAIAATAVGAVLAGIGKEDGQKSN